MDRHSGPYEGENHTGCLQNERADELAELGYVSEEQELCPDPKKYGAFWLRIRPNVRQHAERCKKQLPPRDRAPNKSILQKVVAVNTFRAVKLCNLSLLEICCIEVKVRR